MPELPEVETLRIQLNTLLKGLSISKIDVLKKKSFSGEISKILGKKVTGVRRFGKVLVIDLDDGLSLAVHLKMSGQLIYRGEKQPNNLIGIDESLINLPNSHTRVVVSFTNSDRLFFNDMRIFGWIRVIKKDELVDLFKKQGPEPLRDLTLPIFKNILTGSSKPVKLFLMDQEKISGIGNIYANDALFLSKIHPKRKSDSLKAKEKELLFQNINKILKKAIKLRGASRNQFRDAFGLKGEVQNHFYVYDREGKTCPKCGKEKIKKIELGGRGTFFCPKCQI